MCYLCHSFLSHETENAASLTKKKCIKYLIFQISGAAPSYILAIPYVWGHFFMLTYLNKHILIPKIFCWSWFSYIKRRTNITRALAGDDNVSGRTGLSLVLVYSISHVMIGIWDLLKFKTKQYDRFKTRKLCGLGNTAELVVNI